MILFLVYYIFSSSREELFKESCIINIIIVAVIIITTTIIAVVFIIVVSCLPLLLISFLVLGVTITVSLWGSRQTCYHGKTITSKALEWRCTQRLWAQLLWILSFGKPHRKLPQQYCIQAVCLTWFGDILQVTHLGKLTCFIYFRI